MKTSRGIPGSAGVSPAIYEFSCPGGIDIKTCSFTVLYRWVRRLGWVRGVRAYTLLEVMVALVIMGISISAVAGALSSAKGLSGRANETVEALRVLNNVLNNPPLLRKMAGDEKMTTPLMDDDGWHCSATREPLVIKRGELQLFSSDADDFPSQRGEGEAQDGEGEAVEVPGMVRVTLCVSRGESDSSKSVCMERWLMEP